MSGSATEYHENKTLELLRGSTYTAPAAVYSALYTVVPSDSTAGTEVTNASSGYTRVATTFSTAASGSVTNTGAVTFATAAAAYTVNGWALMDAAAAGNALYWSTVTTLAFAIGDRPTFGVGSIIIAASESSGQEFGPDGEPLYTAGVSTLITAQDSALSYYADITAASATPITGAIRFVPWGPAHSTVVNTVENQITTGKDGLGKAINNHYVEQVSGEQPAPEWDLCNAAKQSAGVTHVWRSQIRYTPSSPPFTGPVSIKHCIFFLSGITQTDSPHYGLKDDYPAGNLPGGKHTAWWPLIKSYVDEIDAYPTGHDQGLNPVGPYFDDVADSGWHRHTMLWRSHSSVGVYDGRFAWWVDGTKVCDISSDTLNVTPSGGTKQWCGVDVLHNQDFGKQNDGGDGTINMSFGSPETTFSQQAWDMAINLGDGDPTNLDTFTWFTY